MLKNLIKFLFAVILIGGSIYIYINQDNIYTYYRDNILLNNKDITITKNNYYKDRNYLYVKNTNDFIAKDKTHLLDIIYTIINSGSNTFTFYCDTNYKDCLKDIEDIGNNQNILSNINNFVHPFNSFERLETSYNERGKITINIIKSYTNEEIDLVNKKVDEIIKKNINDKMSNYDKIKKIHDYIINNSSYIKDDMINNDNANYNNALGNLIEGYAVCSGYSDTMAIFLERFKIDNYKIASKHHIWNLVNINDKWLHLDLTWDDPVTSDNKNHLERYFFLIDNKRLEELNIEDHTYDKDVYLEAK